MTKPVKKDSGLKTIFRALKYRNFRLFFVGQGLSLIGTWIQQIAMGWLVYRLTNSPLLLGVVGFAGQIPTFILSPFTGVMADRWNKRRILIITQALSMVQAFILAVLTLTGNVAIWHIIVLSIFLGCINSLDIPARQSFIVEMIEEKKNLSNGIALNSFMFNGARLIGPSIAGILIAVVGEGICFLINGISFFAVILSLLAMKIKKHEKSKEDSDIMVRLKEGFSYAFGFIPIRFILMLLSIISLTGMSYAVLMPVFARDVLKGGPHTFGILVSSAGVGSLIATVYLASRKSVLGLNRMIPLSAFVFAIGLMAFSLSQSLLLSSVLLAITGFGIMTNMAASNIILQTVVDDDKRGRVMSFYTMAFMGMAPIGSLLAGVMASRIGAVNTLMIGGVVCICGAAIFASKLPIMREKMHPVYRKIGIISEVASGINAASRLRVPPED